jgi:NAD(P)-dependent dehydrogenase (short-subunit alcohol dehydrogenase family)
VTIGSNAGLRGYKNRAGYSASKWALRGLTRTIAIEVGPYNININCVLPGAVAGPRMEMLCKRKAELWGWTVEEVHQHYEKSQVLERTTEAQRGSGHGQRSPLSGQRGQPQHHGTRRERRRRLGSLTPAPDHRLKTPAGRVD